MIVSFSVSNFRSFAEEETLSLVASNRFPNSHPEHLVSIAGINEKVLRTAVVYGANGAGKSNLFKALQYFESMVVPSRLGPQAGLQPFRFTEKQDKPSSFDLQFVAQGTLYRLGFKVDSQRITEEWLARIEGGREKTLYERVTDSQGVVKIEAKELVGVSEKLKALVTVGGLQNQTFLATIKATLEPKDCGEDILRVLDWFGENLQMVEPDADYNFLGVRLHQQSDFLEFAGDFLKSSSTGIDGLEINKQEISEDQLKGILPSNRIARMRKNIEENGFAIVDIGSDLEIIAEKGLPNHYYSIQIRAKHEHEIGKAIPLELAEESDGTRRLLNLIPALHFSKKQGGVFFIDEIDRSMHPLLTIKFLEFFLASCGAKYGQIIVTTHESNLLDLDTFRRDEIWFTEKDDRGATRLYSLAEYNVRKDLEIRKNYLQGRFGAIPFLGNLDRLLEKEYAQ